MKVSQDPDNSWNESLPGLPQPPPLYMMGNDAARERSSSISATTTSETVLTLSSDKDCVDEQVFSATHFGADLPASTGRSSPSSDFNKVSTKNSSPSEQTRTESHPEPPYHVSTYRRKYLLVIPSSPSSSCLRRSLTIRRHGSQTVSSCSFLWPPVFLPSQATSTSLLWT